MFQCLIEVQLNVYFSPKQLVWWFSPSTWVLQIYFFTNTFTFYVPNVALGTGPFSQETDSKLSLGCGSGTSNGLKLPRHSGILESKAISLFTHTRRNLESAPHTKLDIDFKSRAQSAPSLPSDPRRPPRERDQGWGQTDATRAPDKCAASSGGPSAGQQDELVVLVARAAGGVRAVWRCGGKPQTQGNYASHSDRLSDASWLSVSLHLSVSSSSHTLTRLTLLSQIVRYCVIYYSHFKSPHHSM